MNPYDHGVSMEKTAFEAGFEKRAAKETKKEDIRSYIHALGYKPKGPNEPKSTGKK